MHWLRTHRLFGKSLYWYFLYWLDSDWFRVPTMHRRFDYNGFSEGE